MRYKQRLLVTVLTALAFILCPVALLHANSNSILLDDSTLSNWLDPYERLQHRDVASLRGSSLKFSQRVVVLGSVYADYAALSRTLRLAHLIDRAGKWSGKRTVLVLTGNVLGLGADAIVVCRFLSNLQSESARTGGAVTLLLGRHEMWQVLGYWDRVGAADISSFGGDRQRQIAFSSEGFIGQFLAKEFNMLTRIQYSQHYTRPQLNVNRFLPFSFRRKRQWKPQHFEALDQREGHLYDQLSAAVAIVPSGISPALLTAEDPIKTANARGKLLLQRLLEFPFQKTMRAPTITAEEAFLFSNKGPALYHEYVANDNEVFVCASVQETLKALQVSRIISGHNASLNTTATRCQNTLILLNNISPIRGGSIEALEISYSIRGQVLPDGRVRFKEAESLVLLQENKPNRPITRSQKSILV